MNCEPQKRWFNHELLLTFAPWLLIGALVVIGGLNTIVSGLPWASRTDQATIRDQMRDLADNQTQTQRQLEQLVTTVAVLSETVRTLTATATETARMTQENSIHIEGLQADEKANAAMLRTHGIGGHHRSDD